MTRDTQKRIARHIAALNSPDTEGIQKDAAFRAQSYLIRYYGARALEPLLEVTYHLNPVVRYRAAHALGYAKDARALDTLLRLTRDPVGEVRYDAAMALGVLGDERAIDPLIALMSTSDLENCVDSAAATALMRLGKPAIPALLALLQNGLPDTRVRSMTANVLGGIGDERAIDVLAGLLSDDDADMRIAGVEALGAIGTLRCQALIEGRLNDASERVRENATYWYQDVAQRLSEQPQTTGQ